jgi:hypothetical protein
MYNHFINVRKKLQFITEMGAVCLEHTMYSHGRGQGVSTWNDVTAWIHLFYEIPSEP